MDGMVWSSPADFGTWSDDLNQKVARFPNVKSSYVKLKILTASNGSVSASDINVYGALSKTMHDPVTGIHSLPASSPTSIKAYYANNRIIVDGESEMTIKFINLYSITGTMIYTKNNCNAQHYEIPVSQRGIYILNAITSDGSRCAQKVIVN
jgi:hypothetical protein